ncbi:efflux RND transporter periplasmic adaptor subunit [Brumicola blandensis]|jgi:RND family efflux transporter MFP subunit|uniref:Efflux RND transporter periplasmic adaptor subunit n=1 Tax=Brumicola blandensis TaxID=3075611 RepID=A0AAW8QVM3_9ALTE|nr:efflux RND transporter periplasmic adaptor subunit [Alteromonas sp. W409]MDT0581071.1 efflux RND transporter periplasmic adaptor subunit [Alteromonas sp. W409]
MKSNLIKLAIFIVILGSGFAVKALIEGSEPEPEEQEKTDNRPTVSVEALNAIDHQVAISSFGEVVPLERTVLAAQVSGEVTSWNPNFVAGGLVKRGDILFSIEKDAYEAALLQAEAQVSLAEASLIEEQARQKVAMREAKNLPANQVSDLYLRKPQVLSAQAQLKSAQAAYRIAQRDLSNCDVTAPYDALVLSREIGSGQFVNVGMTVAEINNIEAAEVIFPVAGFDSPFLPKKIDNNPATVRAKDVAGISRVAYLQRDLGIVDQSTRMNHLVVRIDDPYSLNTDAPQLKFGTYVEVAFAGKLIENVYKVPQNLVNKRKVWVIDADQKLLSKNVEVVREEGTYFLISSGINEQDQVVMTLPEYPQNGMGVKLLGEDGDKVAANDQ